jgi:hypothetical protein
MERVNSNLHLISKYTIFLCPPFMNIICIASWHKISYLGFELLCTISDDELIWKNDVIL